MNTTIVPVKTNVEVFIIRTRQIISITIFVTNKTSLIHCKGVFDTLMSKQNDNKSASFLY